jgi:hypothetical protein
MNGKSEAREMRPRKERRTVPGQGPFGIVFVRLGHIDERGQSAEQIADQVATDVAEKLDFLLDQYRSGRCVGLISTNVTRGWRQAFLNIADREGRLAHAYFKGKNGGRALVGYFLNVPAEATYDMLADEMLDNEQLSMTAAERNVVVSKLLDDYNRKRLASVKVAHA